MKDLETNKIAAAIFLAGLLALFSGKIADGLYHPVKNPEKRGFEVEVAQTTGDTKAEKVEEIIDIAAIMAAANAEAGKKGFKKCAACHTVDQGGPHRVGPNLAGIVEAPIASKDGYNYSDALKSVEGNWTNENLYAFLNKPKKFAKGTKMTFAGIKKPNQIADIIAYLKSNK